MFWEKLGIVYCPNGTNRWAISHAMIPTPFRLSDQLVRIYLTFCDEHGLGRPGYVDVMANNPRKVVSVSQQPLLELGLPGTFDENGLLSCSVVDAGNGMLYMYYVGFELGKKIRYRLLTGLAISHDGGNTFIRYSQTPVLERSDKELFFRCGPCCLFDAKLFRMWYVAGSEWVVVNGKEMPVYDIRYIESNDGIKWPSEGKVHIPITDPDEHGFGRPYVILKPNGGYRMFYSVRRRSLGAYRLGYAESHDGTIWTRMDDKLNLEVSPKSFDSRAIMYAAPIDLFGQLYVFYNGNDFGRRGFAVARLISD
jgi:hypothetical protein